MVNIRLSQKQKDTLLAFRGYGNPDGTVWFLGMEERGHGEDRLAIRTRFKPVEDLGRAHALLGIAKHHFPPYVLQPTWRTMCEIMLRLANRPVTDKNLQWYQANQLGRFDSDTFLAELLPIPAPGKGQWEYDDLFGTRLAYEAKVRPERIKLLRRLVAKHAPSLVICYGHGDWKHYQALFPNAEWQDHDPFKIGRTGNTFAILTPHFVPYQMSGVRIAELCRLIRHVCR